MRTPGIGCLTASASCAYALSTSSELGASSRAFAKVASAAGGSLLRDCSRASARYACTDWCVPPRAGTAASPRRVALLLRVRRLLQEPPRSAARRPSARPPASAPGRDGGHQQQREHGAERPSHWLLRALRFQPLEYSRTPSPRARSAQAADTPARAGSGCSRPRAPARRPRGARRLPQLLRQPGESCRKDSARRHSPDGREHCSQLPQRLVTLAVQIEHHRERVARPQVAGCGASSARSASPPLRACPAACRSCRATRSHRRRPA